MEIDIVSKIIGYICENYGQFITGLNLICAFFLGLFLIIPGKQPESFLSNVVQFLSRFSKK